MVGGGVGFRLDRGFEFPSDVTALVREIHRAEGLLSRWE